MSKKVNIVVDSSGSMKEDDKNAIVKYILNGINNILEKEEFKDYEFELFQWGACTKKIENFEKAKIEFLGRTKDKEFDILINLMDKRGTILLISDGNFSRSEKEKLKNLEMKIVPIVVGSDANKSMLQYISTSQIAFSAVDLLQAIKNI